MTPVVEPFGRVPAEPIEAGLLWRMTLADVKVYLAIAAHVRGNDWSACPSYDRIALLTGLSRMSVARAVKRLRAIGALLVASGGGRHRRNTYTMLVNSNAGVTELDGNSNSGRTETVTLRARNSNTGETGREKEERREKRKGRATPKTDLPRELDTDAFKAAWAEWMQHRTEIKKKLTPSTIRKQLKDCASWGHDVAIEAIECSIRAGWTGLFQPKGNVHANRNGKAKADRPDIGSNDGYRDLL